MAAGNAMKAHNLRAIYISHLWFVTEIREHGSGLMLIFDGSRSIDNHRKSDRATYEMAMSSLRLYLDEWGPMRFEGQARDFILKHGLTTQAELDRVDEIYGIKE